MQCRKLHIRGGCIGLTERLRPVVAPTQSVHPMTHKIIAPTYFWPGATGVPDGWSRVVLAATYISTVLLNPDSGPGQQQVQAFVDVTQQSQAAGVKVLGYVDSAYGNRAVDDVLSEIDTYSAWYQVDGFFIDDMYSLGKLS